jgi:signal peptidase I
MEVMFHGTSMDPLLFEGDLVVVDDVGFSDIRVGDIVTYRYLDRYPTRRVVGIRPDRLTLWCDAWPNLVFRAAPDDVLGRAVARIRNGHRLDATANEWLVRRDRALRTYRRTQPRLFVRRVIGGVRRRLGRLATSDTR